MGSVGPAGDNFKKNDYFGVLTSIKKLVFLICHLIAIFDRGVFQIGFEVI